VGGKEKTRDQTVDPGKELLALVSGGARSIKGRLPDGEESSNRPKIQDFEKGKWGSTASPFFGGCVGRKKKKKNNKNR